MPSSKPRQCPRLCISRSRCSTCRLPTPVRRPNRRLWCRLLRLSPQASRWTRWNRPTDLPAIVSARESGVPVVLFDSPSPQPDITGVGNNFAEQGEIAARRLAHLLGGVGEVAVMQGVPDAPNHQQRYLAQLAVLSEFPGIAVVEGGSDHDDIDLARQQAESVLREYPDLRGYLACDASGPIGISQALVATGRVGQVQAVGMDSIEPIAAAVADGVLESSVATIPRMQGAMVVLMLWQATLGLALPRFVDTGIEVVTQGNAHEYVRS